MARKFKQYHLLLFFIALIAVSCSSTKTITIEVPKHAKDELPERIQSLVIVNRTLDEEYNNLAVDTLQNIFFAKGFNLDTLIYDKQAADTLMRALGDLLYESGRYDVVIPEDRFLPHKANAFFSEPLTWEEAQQLCTDFNTDAVLSVDLYSTRVITKYDRNNYYNPLDGSFFSSVEANMAIVYETMLKVYDPAEQEIVVREFMRDTLVWEDNDETANALFTHFTSVKQGLTEASIALALDFAEKISTSWQREQRVIFVKGDDKLKEAGELVSLGDWTNATHLWEELAAGSSKAIKSKALLNMAIAAELQGDIDKAIAWGLESYNTQFYQLTYDYLEYLNRRKKEMEKK